MHFHTELFKILSLFSANTKEEPVLAGRLRVKLIEVAERVVDHESSGEDTVLARFAMNLREHFRDLSVLLKSVRYNQA